MWQLLRIAAAACALVRGELCSNCFGSAATNLCFKNKPCSSTATAISLTARTARDGYLSAFCLPPAAQQQHVWGAGESLVGCRQQSKAANDASMLPTVLQLFSAGGLWQESLTIDAGKAVL